MTNSPAFLISRRTLLGASAALSASLALSACGANGASSKQTLKFWDMPWGPAEYSTLAKRIAEDYPGGEGGVEVNYQTVQWNNFIQTFASAVASNTGPAVAAGGAFQVYQFNEEGSIAPADNLVETFKKSGKYDDFFPGTIESFTTDKGICAIPSAIDMRVWWYRKSILDEVGVEVPKNWDELLAVGKKLAAAGYFAFGTGMGAGNNVGSQTLVAMMINNGGGIFNENNEIDVVTDRNLETMDFYPETFAAGMIEPGAVSYSQDNLTSSWKSKRVAMGMHTPGLDVDIDAVGDLLVAPPLAGPHGDYGTLQYVNNVMMFTNSPSQAASEEFLTYWYENYNQLWKEDVFGSGLPVLKSVAEMPEFQQNKQKAYMMEAWQPVAKTFGEVGDVIQPVVAAIDCGQAITELTRKMLAGQTDSRTALIDFEKAIKSL